MVMRSIVMCFSVLCSLSAAAAEVYTWKDKDGKLNYSDTPRPQAQAVEVKPASGDGGATVEREQAAAARAETCRRETDELDRARKATGLRETSAAGVTRDLTADERAQYIARIEQRAAQACAPAPATP